MLDRARVTISSFNREMKEKGVLYAADWWCRRFYYRFVKKAFDGIAVAGGGSGGKPIDIIIPAADKDFDILPLCVESLRVNMGDAAGKILLVSPEDAGAEKLAGRLGCEYVPENDYLPVRPSELRCNGWVLQQLIKFDGHRHATGDRYLAMDADTVFVRPQRFVDRKRSVLKYSDQYELLYNPALRELLRSEKRFPVSFVTHHMVFDCEIVRDLLNGLEAAFGRPWYEVIAFELDHSRSISFSEYELYGNWAVNRFRNRVLLRYWFGLDLGRHDFSSSLEELTSLYGKRYGSLSFHHYLS